ncbi:MAG: hypothetical protein P1U44_02245 [Vicingaceae bacterium]|jgi:hypothetical protein|nr:MAG: hypothetical protein VR77_02245 [Flavobacteriales bacterium BRH_c54]MBL1232347.1 hypothetical protein [Flavobacteriales bacterium]MBQ20317.1 hypothetical protein [Flavobacteriales bacterium]MDF1674508.1 hypothetical protein [Vicingaceae bacterium]|tara:strand:- start:173406 stop:174194 length:789 start_codon:yes stop_codon:yes gene_type:complete
MKRNIFTFILAFFTVISSYAGVIVLEGHYQGKNLYVQNPFAGTGVGFCTFEVTINGDVTTDEVNSSAFEIDFTAFQLKVGDPVIVKIKHKDDCKPKVLNPEVLKPKSTFEIVNMNISKEGNFEWTTSNETGKLTFVVEQFRWNKWIKVGEVDGVGTSTENKYEFKIEPHSGENKFRVKQIDYSGKPRYSQAARYVSTKGEITFSPIKVKDIITFTDETLFEVYDSYANIVKKGYGNSIDVTNLKKGIYYLNYDNKSETFVKK